jgi:hypothetical protein
MKWRAFYGSLALVAGMAETFLSLKESTSMTCGKGSTAEQSGEREPPMTQVLISQCFGGGPVTAVVLAWIKNIVLVLSETVLVLVIESRQS